MKNLVAVVIVLLFQVFSFASSADAKKYAKVSANYLFELNRDGLKQTLEPLLAENSTISSLQIIDSADGGLFYSYGKTNCVGNEKKYESKILYDNQQIGKLTICAKVANQGGLSDEELAFIAQNKKLRVHNERNWAPFNFNKNGVPSGYSIDYMKLLASKVGFEVEFVTGEWNELLNMAMNKKLDVMLNIAYTKEREKHITYIGEYISTPIAVIARKNDSSITNIESLNGKKVAVVEGFFDESFLMQNYPLAQRVVYKNGLDALKAVEYKEVDATIARKPVANYTINELMLALEVKAEVKTKNPNDQKLYIAIKNNAPLLASILKKAMKLVSNQEMAQLQTNWLTFKTDNQTTQNPKNQQGIALSEAQKKWLDSKGVIRFAVDPTWSPIENIQEKTNTYDGMNADLLQLISERSGIKFELVPTKDWAESTALSKEGKVDMLACVSRTPQREEYLNFSNKTIELTDGILMRSDAEFIDNINDLKGMRVGVPDGTSLHTKLKKEYPHLILVPIKGTQKAVEMLSNKEIDVYAGNLEVSGYYIQQLGLFNLKVVYRFEEKRAMHIALQKTIAPEAMDVINKALASINDEELQTIRQRWIGLKVTDSVDYKLMIEIAAAVLVLILFILYNNWRLKKIVNAKTADLVQQKEELAEFNKNLEAIVQERTKALDNEKRFVNSIMNSQTSIVISTDGTKLKTANKAFFRFFELDTIEEFFQKYGRCICDTFDIDDSGKYIQKIMANKTWITYVYEHPEHIYKAKITRNNKEYIFAITTDKFIFDGEELETAVLSDITELEIITEESENSSLLMKQLLNSIPNPIFYKNEKGEFIGFNEAYEKVFGVDSKNLLDKTVMDLDYLPLEDRKIYHAEDISIIQSVSSLQREQEMVFCDNAVHTTLYSVNAYTKRDGTPGGLIGIFTDITEQKKMEKEVRAMHKHTRESIEYASLIQHSLIPSNNLFRKYFSDYLTIWHPKDIVGGDIYLFEELRDENECLLIVVDCTGHGVPGAFVTMLVKAIERQVIAKINNDLSIDVSPAWILAYFNRTMKKLLKQENESSISNAGFDGAILYYNKREKVMKYAGAETALFYVEDDELKTLKGDRHSVGYKKSDMNYKFKEHIINAKDGMKFYISTDGYLDQNGGEKGFPFGKKRFSEIISEFHHESFADQQEIFLDSLHEYQQNEDRNDDVTVIGMKI